MHPLKNPTIHRLEHSHAAVRVERKGNQLVVQPGSVDIIKVDTEIAAIPSSLKVVDASGQDIPASSRFWITTSTIDPYHLVLDM